MKISKGIKEDGIVVGNNYDKYGSKNPIARTLMSGFENSLLELMALCPLGAIHEVGCGEGFWVSKWAIQGHNVHGSDFSHKVIEIARRNAKDKGLSDTLFKQKSIYDLEPKEDGADLVICCEVLEHLEDPLVGLERLSAISKSRLIISVPREPVWCMMNMARGKYLSSFGNTPGHIQHWSSSSFIKFASNYFDVIEVRKPLPWTMLLCQKK